MQKEEPLCPSSIAFAHSYTAIRFLSHPKEVKKKAVRQSVITLLATRPLVLIKSILSLLCNYCTPIGPCPATFGHPGF
ncbi:hypothetical protein [Hoylesella nanceiensis]|uniref:hypothetical protein n=1 Tax=Hoylesella nanceiensis TaxID=425941 RepID=UPI001CB50D72|nr:hypothetical protein [Hoylesella nanceiensis]MBF1427583.1 hypothetical protein [Hoylesella nanceiensis]